MRKSRKPVLFRFRLGEGRQFQRCITGCREPGVFLLRLLLSTVPSVLYSVPSTCGSCWSYGRENEPVSLCATSGEGAGWGLYTRQRLTGSVSERPTAHGKQPHAAGVAGGCWRIVRSSAWKQEQIRLGPWRKDSRGGCVVCCVQALLLSRERCAGRVLGCDAALCPNR